MTRALFSLARRGAAGRTLATRLEGMRTAGGWRALGQGAGHDPSELSRYTEETYRQIWAEAAQQLGVEMTEIAPGYLRLCADGAETLVWLQRVMLDTPVTTELAADKPAVRRLLRDAGVPMPEAALADVEGPDRLLDLLRTCGSPLAVKPARGTGGGAGVTCGVRTPAALVRAWLVARRFSPTVLAERQVDGDDYRLLFLDGALLGAVRRRPPTVVGDGRRSIRELIEALNAHRLALGAAAVPRLVHVDLECRLVLGAAGLSPDAVLERGRRVAVKLSASENGRPENETWREFSPQLVETAARAAAAVRLRLAGVDVVTADPRRRLEESGGAVIEVNGTPGLQHHYQVSRPDDRVPVAVPILERLLSDSPPRNAPAGRGS